MPEEIVRRLPARTLHAGVVERSAVFLIPTEPFDFLPFEEGIRAVMRVYPGRELQVHFFIPILDSQGGVHLPDNVWADAGVRGERVVLVDYGNRFEVWDEGRWDAKIRRGPGQSL